MDSSSKTMKINSSSLVSLKAELLRKEQEYQAERLQSKSTNPRHVKTKVKADGVGAQNAGVNERNAKDIEETIKENNEARNSREMLEKKAKIYDAMSKGYIQDDDDNEHCLIDFYHKQRESQSSNNTRSGGVEIAPPEVDGTRPSYTGERTEPPAEAAPIHYANVQHNEIRSHGIGYFQFSEDDGKRQEQMELLNKLRTQTEDQKARKERLKEKKKNMMAQRLSKMRQRRGLPEPEPEEEEEEKKADTPEVASLVRNDAWRDLAPITREWDKGKKKDLNRSYLERRRDERLQEFAPPVQLNISSSTGDKGWTPSEAPIHTLRQEQPKAEEMVDTTSIEQTLKSIRTEGEQQERTKPGSDSYMVKSEQNPTRDLTGIDLGDIPLPPSSKATNSTNIVNGEPADATSMLQYNPSKVTVPAVSDQTSTLYQGMGSAYDASSTVPQYAIPESQEIMTSAPVIAPSLDPNSHDSYMSQALNDLQYLDTSQPPPSINDMPYQQPEPYSADPPGYVSVDLGQDQSQAKDQTMPSSMIDSAETSSVSEAASTDENPLKRPAPQPAHYSSAPSKVQIQKQNYERVHLHRLPLNLPAPPSAENVPTYRAQDSANIPKAWDEKKARPNRNTMHMWNTQYDYKGPKKE